MIFQSLHVTYNRRFVICLFVILVISDLVPRAVFWCWVYMFLVIDYRLFCTNMFGHSFFVVKMFDL